MKQSYLYLFLIICLLYGCSNNSPDDLINNEPLPQTVTYDAQIAPIMQSQCVNCHSTSFPSGGLNLEGYQNVRQSTENGNLIDRISRPVGDPLIMPQNGQLPQNNINLIIQWQTDGYIEN